MVAPTKSRGKAKENNKDSDKEADKTNCVLDILPFHGRKEGGEIKIVARSVGRRP